MTNTPEEDEFDKKRMKEIEELQWKARAYDHYAQAVENGDIVVLSRQEVEEFVQNLPTGFGITSYLEKHSNWRRKR